MSLLLILLEVRGRGDRFAYDDEPVSIFSILVFIGIVWFFINKSRQEDKKYAEKAQKRVLDRERAISLRSPEFQKQCEEYNELWKAEAIAKGEYYYYNPVTDEYEKTGYSNEENKGY